MRQGQQHRRGRSRGSSGGNGSHGGHSHNQRKGQNPLSRSFESNGPDVKVRGTAADVAGKYMMLARDAQSSGDPVLAENYLQHAEHYNRMIIAYREQQMQQQGGDTANGNGHRMRNISGVDMGDLDDEIGGEPIDPGMGEQPSMPFARQEGQPRPERQENGRHNDDRRPQHGRQQDHRSDQRSDQRHDRQENRQDRGDNPRFRDRRFDRGGERSERHERSDRPDHRGERGDAPQDQVTTRGETIPVDQPQPVIDAVDTPPPREPAAPRRRERVERAERVDMMKDQPEFLRRPVRRPRREEPSATEGSDEPASGSADRQEKPTV